MLQPKKQKYRKQFRADPKGKASSAYSLDFGEYGLKALEAGWLSARQIEAARKAMTHYTKRQAKLWIRSFPDRPVTSKAAGAQMGGGKGDVVKYVAAIKPGRIIFELGGVDKEIAREAIRRAGAKLPFKTKFVEKGQLGAD